MESNMTLILAAGILTFVFLRRQKAVPAKPTLAPTVIPPTVIPTLPPTVMPTLPPTVMPTLPPTVMPTTVMVPTVIPTIPPTVMPKQEIPIPEYAQIPKPFEKYFSKINQFMARRQMDN